MEDSTKPAVLICSSAVYGHVLPMLAIARELVRRGYHVVFACAVMFEKAITSTGALFVPYTGPANITEEGWATMLAKALSLPKAELEMLVKGIFFTDRVTFQYAGLQNAITEIRQRWGEDKKVVILGESCCNAMMPMILGAPGLTANRYISIGCIPILMRSVDHHPFARGPPDRGPPVIPSTPESRAQNAVENANYAAQFSVLQQRLEKTLFEELGCTKKIQPNHILYNELTYWLPDVHLHLCGPSFEYPRSDGPPEGQIKFIGSLPPGHREAPESYPEWWNEVTGGDDGEDGDKSKSPKKKKKVKNIILVAQGTLQIDYTQLIIPTLKALTDMEDTLVIAALGKKGATLPSDPSDPEFPPQNARIVDYFPFDEIFLSASPAISAFVTNGGYGGTQHSLRHGVPLVVAGLTEDKSEISSRVEWTGCGVNLRSSTPSQEAIREAVEKVLSDEKYRLRAREMQREVEGLDTFALIEAEILKGM